MKILTKNVYCFIFYDLSSLVIIKQSKANFKIDFNLNVYLNIDIFI